eukprot:TRINITY_DN14980_c0_g1_i1.p1 TRINITY_DN14980_c0_g1~~TRINITY_DN14980_c0_g1_i1.p1  ORF type:complete len:298 (+),score=31.22 TRINITY_DN14980_c0_g1_i1:243-1136(+)
MCIVQLVWTSRRGNMNSILFCGRCGHYPLDVGKVIHSAKDGKPAFLYNQAGDGLYVGAKSRAGPTDPHDLADISAELERRVDPLKPCEHIKGTDKENWYHPGELLGGSGSRLTGGVGESQPTADTLGSRASWSCCKLKPKATGCTPTGREGKEEKVFHSAKAVRGGDGVGYALLLSPTSVDVFVHRMPRFVSQSEISVNYEGGQIMHISGGPGDFDSKPAKGPGTSPQHSGLVPSITRNSPGLRYYGLCSEAWSLEIPLPRHMSVRQIFKSLCEDGSVHIKMQRSEPASAAGVKTEE